MKPRKNALYRIGCMLIALSLLATGWAFAETESDARPEKDVWCCSRATSIAGRTRA